MDLAEVEPFGRRITTSRRFPAQTGSSVTAGILAIGERTTRHDDRALVGGCRSLLRPPGRKVLTQPSGSSSPSSPSAAIQVVAHHDAMAPVPENTSRALEFSIADGVEWFAVNVRITKDGHHVLFHDGELEKTTDGSGPLCDSRPGGD